MNSSLYTSAVVISNQPIGNQIRHLKIKADEPMPYEAGQFFILQLHHGSGECIERSYSVANFSNGPLIEFVVRIEAQGKMTQLIDRLTPGDQLSLKGPFGHFGSISDSIDQLILVAGGVGISPFRSILQKSFQRKETFPIQLFYGFRTPQDFLFREELEHYTSTGRLTLIPLASEGAIDGEGRTGFISDFLKGNIFSPKENTHCLVCGPPLMVKATKEKLLSLGFDRRQIHLEAW